MKNDQNEKYLRIRKELDEDFKKMQKFFDFSDVEFPKIRKI